MAYSTRKPNKESQAAKVVNLWREIASPLRYLTKSTIQMMLDMARQGNDSRLQVAVAELERCMPIYGVVIQRRLAGIQNRRWKIAPLYPESKQSVEQAQAVEDIFRRSDTKNLHGLTEAIRHLGMASFRGRSAVKPVVTDGELSFYNIENWNLLEWNGKLYFAPNASEFNFLPATMDSIPNGVSQVPEG